MNEFVSWEVLGTYGGAIAMTVAITQMVKGVGVLKKISTQLVGYVVALIVLIGAHSFTDGLSASNIGLIIFNAVIVSIGATGTHAGIKKVATSIKENG